MFEDLLAPVPGMIVDYLKEHYGETWMMIPEHDDQAGHNVVINLNVPYADFKKDYLRFLKKDALKKYKEFHDLRVDIQNTKLDVNKMVSQFNSVYNSMIINKKLDDRNISKLYYEKKYNKLYNLFLDYYNLQLDKSYIKNKVNIDIGDNTYFALKILIIFGFYYKAKKIMGIMDSNRYLNLKEEIRIIDKLNDYYYNEEFDKYRDYVNKYFDIYLDDLDFVRGYANVLIYEGKYDEAFSYINDKLKIFKDDDFLLKYKADVLMVKNRKGAVNLYNEVLNKTNNGILILEIKDILEGVNYE